MAPLACALHACGAGLCIETYMRGSRLTQSFCDARNRGVGAYDRLLALRIKPRMLSNRQT